MHLTFPSNRLSKEARAKRLFPLMIRLSSFPISATFSLPSESYFAAPVNTLGYSNLSISCGANNGL